MLVGFLRDGLARTSLPMLVYCDVKVSSFVQNDNHDVHEPLEDGMVNFPVSLRTDPRLLHVLQYISG